MVYGRLNEGGCGGRARGPEVNCLKGLKLIDLLQIFLGRVGGEGSVLS